MVRRHIREGDWSIGIDIIDDGVCISLHKKGYYVGMYSNYGIGAKGQSKKLCETCGQEIKGGDC